MSATLLERPAEVGGNGGNGGVPARRAVVRWAWRLFRREWRQESLVLALITVAIAATVVGAAVAVNTPPPANAGFGTATVMVTMPGSDPHLDANIATLEQHFGTVDVIENRYVRVPGSVQSADLRAQDPHGAYGRPMLSLVSGRYPAGPDEVAVTAGVASSFGLSQGGTWTVDGRELRVVGTVENPQNLADEFGLVAPGEIGTPTQVTVLLDAAPRAVLALQHTSAAFGPSGDATFHSPGSAPSTGISPEIIVLSLATFGLLLIGFVAVAGFTVMAQRRMRALGMLGALGATDRHVRLVMTANGAVVGVVGTLAGAALGLLAWVAYRPRLETSAGHQVDLFALPWWLVITAMILAPVMAVIAARYPARAAARVPIVAALSGRPAPPKAKHRSLALSAALIGIGFVLIYLASPSNGNAAGGPLEVIGGIVTITIGGLFLAPFAIQLLAELGRHATISARLALRDLARYRSRSGAALGAITLAVTIAVIVCVAAAARFGDVLDYVGPNLASNQLVVYPSGNGPNSGPVVSVAGPSGSSGPSGPKGSSTSTPTPTPAEAQAKVNEIALALGTSNVLPLETSSATLIRATPGSNNFSGQVFIATPELLRHYGISQSDIDPNADILTSRAGLADVANLDLIYGPDAFPQFGPGPGGNATMQCHPGSCVANPRIQTLGSLPTGTSTPNVVITEHAISRLGLSSSVSTAGWLIESSGPLTSVQINTAEQIAGTAGMTVETANDEPSLSELNTYAVGAGLVLALGVLAMTVGLIRSETAADLRILTATGASRTTRRRITGVTAGALGLLGALLGTALAYVALIAFFRTKLGETLSHIPVGDLMIIIIGLPLAAAVGGWLFAGRVPPGIARQPIE
jgi:putative ABC transport system permease protein